MVSAPPAAPSPFLFLSGSSDFPRKLCAGSLAIQAEQVSIPAVLLLSLLSPGSPHGGLSVHGTCSLTAAAVWAQMEVNE